MTEHHRRPKQQGGKKNWPPNNITMLPRRVHEIWHILFDTWAPNVVAAEASRYLEPGFFFVAAPLSRRRLHAEQKWHKRWRENRDIRPELWEELFAAKKRSPMEIAAIISRYFLDPDFELMAIAQPQVRAVSAAG